MEKKQAMYRIGFGKEKHKFPEHGFRLTGPDGKQYKLEFDAMSRLVINACDISTKIVVYPHVSNEVAVHAVEE